MTKNKITEGNSFSLCINQAVWAEIGGEETPIPANELEDVHLYIGRGPYKAQAIEYPVMASGDTLIAYIDHTLKVGMYSTWITAYCNGRRVASNCKEAFEIVSFDENCSNVVNEVYVCPAIYLQGTTAADEAIRQIQEAERVAAEAERKKTFDALKSSFVAFLSESKEQWGAWMTDVRQVWTSWFDSVKESWTSWFADIKTEWQAFFAASKAHDGAIQQAEQERASEEAKRQQQEQLRADAESNRALAEEQRISTFESNEQERADTFSQNESERDIAFKASEKNRADTFDANETERANTFNTNEASRNNTFNTNESDRAATFETNEQRRDEEVRADKDALVEDMQAAAQLTANDHASLPLLCGQPMTLFGAGTPQEAIVPSNWKQFDPVTGTGYNWNGTPSAEGQVYINTLADVNGRYTAIRSGHSLIWKNF